MKQIFVILFALCAATQSQGQAYTLADCRRLALQHSEDMLKAGISVERAELDRQVAFGAYLPTVAGSFMTALVKDQKFSDMDILLRGTYMAGISVAQPLFVGGKIVNANRLAKVGKKVAEEQLRQQRQQCIADVDKAFYSLVSVRSKVKMLESLHAQLDSLTEQVRTSTRAEMATDADLLRVEAKRSEVDYNLQKAQGGERLCRMVLCSAIGLPLDSEIEVSDTDDLPALGALNADVGLRPEVSMLQSAIDAKRLQVRMARADLLPIVALSLGYTYYGNIRMRGAALGPDGNLYPYEQPLSGHVPMAMVSVKVPIFDFGSYKKLRQSKLDVRTAELDLQKNTRLMTIEAQQTVQVLEDARRLLATATLGQCQAEENLRVMRLRYKAQMTTLTDLLDAESQWQQAHSNLIEAQTQLRLAHTDYLRATGLLGE